MLDGRSVGPALDGLAYTVPRGSLSTGVHDVQVLARDSFGQEFLSASSRVKIDGSPPRARISRHGRALVVELSDSGSGLVQSSIHVAFGDGTHAAGRRRAGHRYTRSGTFTLYVTARDHLGNR